MKKSLSLVLVLAMVLGCFSFASAASYNDVAGTSYEDAVARLSLLEILTGYKDGTFKPEGQITRAEFAAVAVRAKGLEATAQASKGLPTGFSDVPTTHWASGYIGTAAKMGIVNGVGNGQFAPAAPVKYEEAITMLVRALGYDPSAQVRGGYPYGYLIVANENGLLDDVKGTQGAPALRGEVAQIVDNALEIPMMVQVGYGTDTKWVVSGSKEHGGDERYLLDDMGFDSVKGRVVSVNTKTKKLTVEPKDKDLKNVVIEVADGFDFYSVEGLTTKFWYKNDKLVVYVVKEEAKFDAVKYDKDEKELKLITEDENYEVAKDAYLELNGKKVKADKFEADYAKIVLNDDDEIVFAEGYTLDGFVLVEEVKDNVAYSYDEFDEIKIKDFLVVEDGKTIGIDGIEEKDILFFNTDEKFAVVSNKGTEGELDRVYTDGTFRFEGSAYGKSEVGTPIYFDEGKVGELDADILDDFLDEEEKVTVYVDFAGDVVVVAGEVSSVGNSAYSALTADAVEYGGRKGKMIALDVRNGANEKVSYDLVVKDLEKDIKLTGITAEKLAKLKKADDVVLKISVDKDGDVNAIELPESVELSKAFDIDDANAKGTDGYSYKLQASTIVFYDGNKKAATLGNAKDAFKEVKSGATIFFEKGRVVAVIGETDADADTKDVTGLVTRVKESKKGKLEFSVKVFGTTERLLTESKSLKESAYTKYVDHIVTFTVGETSGEIKDEKDSIVFTSGKTLTITKVSGRTISSKEYDDVELNTKGKIYDKDLDEINLRDLKRGMEITVYFQGSSRRFVDYVIAGEVGGSSGSDATAGVVTYINAEDGSFAIGNDAFKVNADTKLFDANGNIEEIGISSLLNKIKDKEVTEIKKENGVVTSLRLVGTEAKLDELLWNKVKIASIEDNNSVEVPFSTKSVPTVSAKATEKGAKVEITQATKMDGGADAVATVKVTSEDGKSNETYTVTFTKANASNDATLKAITVGGTSYTVADKIEIKLPEGSTKPLEVKATATDSNAKVNITPAKDVTSDVEADRTTVIKVTAEDKEATKEYKVIFTVSDAE